jgi:PRTRC genetic system protein B
VKTIDLKFEYTLEAALMIYREASNASTVTTRLPYYLELHPVCNQDGVSALQAGTPLSERAASDLARALTTGKEAANAAFQLLPEGLLAHDTLTNRYAIWYEPAQTRYVQFTHNSIPDRFVQVPAMLFIRSFTTLRAFALASDARPAMDTRLFYAPFHNVNQHGNVCLGSASFKRECQTLAEEVSEYSRGFWSSRFSATHNTNAVAGKHTLGKVWSMKAREKNPFPTRYLVPAGKTLADLVKTL